ncbi:MAG TPA: Dabb family protein [Bacteroidales bacterium]|nr:Dabb family protein [Bacteroidales bacterium]
MIKHVVCWQLYDQAEGRDKATNCSLVKAELLALKELIPEMRSVEVGENIPQAGSENYDVVLIAGFDTLKDLQRYQEHSEHQRFKKFVSPLQSDKIAVDFEF